MFRTEFSVKCDKCEKSFKSFQAQASHIKWIHGTLPRYQCTLCLKKCSDSDSLNRHVKSVHEKESYKHVCPVCGSKINKKCAPQHFLQHGVSMETETLIFIDGTSFEQWKRKMEKETNSKFVKHCGNRIVREGVVVNEYYCHRSGNFISKGQGIRSPRAKGSVKIDAYCPAAIVTHSSTSGEVVVTFQKTHVGHEKAFGRQSLREEKEEAEFSSERAMEVTPEHILEEIQSDLEERKASLVAKFSEMVTSVQSDAGLQALENHIAPLQFIIDSAEEKASVSFPQVSVIMQEPTNKTLSSQKKFYSTKKTKKSKLGNLSLSEYDSVTFLMVTGLPQDLTL